jgi:hypothetical protein
MRLSNKHLKIISLIVAVVAVVAFLSSSSSSSNPGVSSEKVIKMDPMTSPDIMTDPAADLSGPWPNCVGMTGEECKAFIEADSPDLKGRVYIIGPDMMVTMDYRLDRVRISVNETGIVESAPGRG